VISTVAATVGSLLQLQFETRISTVSPIINEMLVVCGSEQLSSVNELQSAPDQKLVAVSGPATTTVRSPSEAAV